MDSETPVAGRRSPMVEGVTNITQTAPFYPYLMGMCRLLTSGD